MIENRPWLTIFSHTMLILGIALAGLACVGCVASFVIVAVKNKKRKHRE